MGRIQPYSFDTGLTTGGAGASTATSPAKRVTGIVRGVGVTYTGSPPATTDVTVRTKGRHGPARNILALTNANTNGWWQPTEVADDTAGADRLHAGGGTGVPHPIAVDDDVDVLVAQADDDDSVQVVLLVED